MRSSAFLTAAFAGCALSSPLVKRNPVLKIETVTDEVYVTDIVTVTAGASTVVAVTTTPAAPSTTVAPSTVAAVATSAASPSSSSSSFSSSSSSFKVAPVEHDAAPHGSTSVYSWSTAWTSAWTSTIEPSSVASSSVYIAPSSSSVYIAPSSSSVYVAPPSSAPASTTSAAETTTSAASSTATSYQEIVIAHHNVHRGNHSASDLTWSDDLASSAASIAATCVYEHNMTTNGGGYGQNIAAGVEANNVSAVITELFYNGEVGFFADLYGQANPTTNFESWGHFSQLVWKATTQVGCATQDCSSSGLANTGSDVSPYFTVCNYGPAGNYANEYADNIGEPLNRATVEWNYGL